MRYTLHSLFENVFWAAAAGNVFWSLCNVALEPKDYELLDRVPRLIILGFFAAYLTVSWLHVRVSRVPFSKLGWFFELAHLSVLVLCAIATQLNPAPTFLDRLLAAYFGVTMLGHILGVWRLPTDSAHQHWYLAAANAIGLIVLGLGWILGLPDALRLPASFALAFVAWLVLGRWKDLRQIEVLLEGDWSRHSNRSL